MAINQAKISRVNNSQSFRTQSLFGERTVDQFPRTAGIWAGLMKDTFTLPSGCWYLLPTYVMTLTEQWKLIELPDGGKLCESWLTLVASRDALSAWNKTVSSARCPLPELICFDCSCVIKYWLKKINSFVCGLILKMIMMNNDIGLGLYCAFLPQS